MAWNRGSILLLALFLCLLLVSSDGRNLQSHISHVSKLAGQTNPKDVQGLVTIVNQFVVLTLMGSYDDPCLPNPLSWIQCSNDSSPRVTALYLANQNLLGEIPDFSVMDALVTIEMQNNALTGNIPSFLGNLPVLTELNLANNLLSGNVPASIIQNKKLTADVSGNVLLQLPSNSNGGGTTTTPSTTSTTPSTTSTTPSSAYTYQITPTGKKKSNLGPIVGGVVAGLVMIGAVVGIFAIYQHRAKVAMAVAQANAEATKPVESTGETPLHAGATARS